MVNNKESEAGKIEPAQAYAYTWKPFTVLSVH